MTPQQQEQIFDEQTKAQRETMFRKRADYTDGLDCLSNFKRVAAMCELPVDKVFEVLIATKFVRLDELTKAGRAPMNESLDDNYKDSNNYYRLWDMWRRELHANTPVEHTNYK